jgi:hypothetical protein
MKKWKLILFLLLVLILGLVLKFDFASGEQDSLHDGKYIINGERVVFRNGISEEEMPDSRAKVVTRYFGNDAGSDFDKDGKEDIVFLVTQNTGGSGTFYYLVARLNGSFRPKGSYGLYLGDRIAPQNIEIKDDNVIVVNYADRRVDESFVVPPSVGKSLFLSLDPKTMQFGEVIQDFN